MSDKILKFTYISLSLYSSVLLAAETAEVSETEQEAVQAVQEVKQEAESQAVIEQASAASENGDDKEAKAWIPSAENYDWVQLTSNEWLKGQIKGMYKDSLEFDSDKLDLLSIDWEDVKILRSYRVSNINIEDVGATSGILEVTDNTVRVINDYEDQTYNRSNLISFAPGGVRELDLWSIKVALSLDLRQGNTDQIDYTAKANLKRRASLTRLTIDYIGNISKTNGGDGSLVETINNNRLNVGFDYYKTRYFFFTPIFAELYRDPFVNIDLKTTIGAGIGYTVIDDGRTELSFAGGPAYMRTSFISVAPGESNPEETPALVLRTDYDFEVNSITEIIAKYNIQVGNQASGGYTHHIILTLENEITGALDIDTSFIWDRTSNPIEAADGTRPQQNDYRLTVGISYDY